MRDAKREQEWTKRLVRIGEFMDSIENGVGTKGLEGGRLVEVRILTNARTQGDTLIVVKAREADAKFVAFVGARNIAEAILTWRQKEAGNGLRWRTDKPWGPGGG